VIEIRNVSKRYGDTTVVDDVTLTLSKGGVTAIIGPNGAGKSTLLSIMSRITAADHGQVLVDGMDVTATRGDVLAQRLSFMRQDTHVAARLTVEDLIGFGRYPYSKGRLRAEDRDHVERAIGFVALEPYRHRFLDELSGGQRQRAFIAMVLAQDADYLLFDEPLNNLDMRHAVATMKLMRRMADDFGKTIVVVLHDINFASIYADRIVAMRNGAVLRVGPAAEIVQSGSLRDIFDMEFRIFDEAGRRFVDYYT
jgi:iron complex transport system ATP-binding protein